MVGLLTQHRFSYEGEHFTIDGGYCEPKPVQTLHPPICIGGSGEKRTLRTVARLAQHWNYLGGPVDEFRRLRGVMDAHCADVGRVSRTTTSTHMWVDPTQPVDPAAIAAQAEAYVGSGLDLAIRAHVPYDAAVLAPIAEALAPLADA